MKKSGIWFVTAAALLLTVLLVGFFSWRNASRAPMYILEETRPKTVDSNRININTATVEQLQTLPGIGPVYAQRIVQYRQENGPFSTVGEITAVQGIGIATLEQILDYITVGDQT